MSAWRSLFFEIEVIYIGALTRKFQGQRVISSARQKAHFGEWRISESRECLSWDCADFSRQQGAPLGDQSPVVRPRPRFPARITTWSSLLANDSYFHQNSANNLKWLSSGVLCAISCRSDYLYSIESNVTRTKRRGVFQFEKIDLPRALWYLIIKLRLVK